MSEFCHTNVAYDCNDHIIMKIIPKLYNMIVRRDCYREGGKYSHDTGTSCAPLAQR